MQGSINFDGSLIGNITGGGGGGGSEVVITPVLTSGTKIADVTVDGEDKDLFAPTPDTGVSVSQVLTEGTKIASIEVDGESTDIFAPTPTPPTPATEVSVTQTLASGTKIGSIEVDGESTDLYAPYQSAVNTSYDNTISGLAADNVQEAIDGISGITGDGQLDIGDNLTDAVNKIKQSLSDFETLEKTASGAIATFDDGSDLPMPSLKVAIEPQQEGSGDPSPTNIRLISGWSDVNVTVADATINPTISNTYTIDLDGTRYGGELDVVSGVLTVTSKMYVIDENEANMSIQSSRDFGTVFKVTSGQVCLNNNTQISNYLKYHVNAWSIDESRLGTFVMGAEGNIYLQMPISVGGTVNEFKTWLENNNIQIMYPLATPLTIQLTPTQVKSLLGDNNVWADTGNIELTYLTNNPLTQTVYDMVKILVEQST